jgi:putative ABC transport system substrate-binding protein
MVSRRSFLALLAWPALASAQTAPKPARVGILTSRRREAAAAWLRGFREAYGALGTPLSVELRFADADVAKLPALADELGKRGLQAIVAADEASFLAARRANLPVVAASATTPIDLAPRQVELLMAVRPKLARLAVLVNPKNSTHGPYFNAVGAAAQPKGVRVLGVEVEFGDDLEAAFKDMRANRIGALAIAPDGLFSQEEVRLAGLARQYRLASMASEVTYANTGGLMSYGDDSEGRFRAIAQQVDRLVKGGQPAPDAPYESEKTPLVVNRTTAKAIGVRLPQQIVREAKMVE